MCASLTETHQEDLVALNSRFLRPASFPLSFILGGGGLGAGDMGWLERLSAKKTTARSTWASAPSSPPSHLPPSSLSSHLTAQRTHPYPYPYPYPQVLRADIGPDGLVPLAQQLFTCAPKAPAAERPALDIDPGGAGEDFLSLPKAAADDDAQRRTPGGGARPGGGAGGAAEAFEPPPAEAGPGPGSQLVDGRPPWWPVNGVKGWKRTASPLVKLHRGARRTKADIRIGDCFPLQFLRAERGEESGGSLRTPGPRSPRRDCGLLPLLRAHRRGDGRARRRRRARPDGASARWWPHSNPLCSCFTAVDAPSQPRPRRSPLSHTT